MSGFTDLWRAGPLQFSRPEGPEASYNVYHHLIRDACGADFQMPLQFVSWLTQIVKHFLICGMASMPMVQVAALRLISSTQACDWGAHLADTYPGFVNMFHPVFDLQNYYIRCYDNAVRSVDGPQQILGESTNVHAASDNAEHERGSAGSL